MEATETPALSLAQQLRVDPSLCDLWDQLDADTQAATALVLLVSAGADSRLREKYARKWWSEFLPDRVKVSALTSCTLSEFTAELARRLGGQIGSWWQDDGATHRQVWQHLISLPVQRQRLILDILETQPTVCVTLVRADLDAKRQRKADGQTQDELDAYRDFFAAQPRGGSNSDSGTAAADDAGGIPADEGAGPDATDVAL